MENGGLRFRYLLTCSFCVSFFLTLFYSNTIVAQTVSGTVTDARTGETLIGATILETTSGKGTVTNAHGRYTLTPGVTTAELRVSYIGYTPQQFTVGMRRDTALNVRLEPSVNLEEVTITADRVQRHEVSQMSAIEIPVEQIKMVPVIFGEADILKAIQLLPGVQSGGEGQSGLYVRGGGPDENLFLLDGIPLYNVNHLGGFFSAFNSNALKNVTLYKGSFPARFSGRISSVLDITTNNGNDKEWHGTASVGLIAANVSVEGPIVKERTTLSASLRRTYFDILMQPLIMMAAAETGGDMNAGYYFYDLNAKLTHKFNDRSRLYASFYMGDDALYAKISEGGGFYNKEYMKIHYGWGNMSAALRWNYELTPQLFMNVTGAYTRYRNLLSVGGEMEERLYDGTLDREEMEMSYNSGIQDFTARADFDYTPRPEHNIRFGGVVTHHLFSPEVAGFKMRSEESGTVLENIDTTLGESKVRAEEMTLYVEDDWSITDVLKVNAGVALAGFAVEGAFYPSVQPRLSGRLMLSDDLSLKAGYAYMTQYLHLLSTSNVSLPTDLWVPVTRRIPPMNSHQVALGAFYNRWDIDFSAEVYYKWMNNLMEYLPGSTFFGNSTGWEDKVCLGQGRAYGLELLAQKTVGKVTGWVGYTLSRTLRQFDMLNDGKEFPAKYDRIHDLSITLQYKHSDNFDIAVTWVYATGNTATLALHQFEGQEESAQWTSDGLATSSYGYVESRNNFRMPSYHRMDVSLNFHKQKKHGVRTWNISVYNLYNRQNPFLVYRGYRHGSPVLKQLSLFPILPSVAYIYKF